jgi:hypothetical protein
MFLVGAMTAPVHTDDFVLALKMGEHAIIKAQVVNPAGQKDHGGTIDIAGLVVHGLIVADFHAIDRLLLKDMVSRGDLGRSVLYLPVVFKHCTKSPC